MIPQILDQVPPNAVMYLVNALAFEAKWRDAYREYQVTEGKFTREDGNGETVEFMRSIEKRYLENEKATGFMKEYMGGRYAFAALLPKEGVSVAELIASLTGEELHQMLAHPETVYDVDTALPKFESKCSLLMNEALIGMGMPDAFDDTKADFSAMGNVDVYINRVLHKTFISVGEQGTRAGAATVVEMTKNTAVIDMPEQKTVILDRPFVYMLVDTETGTPLFIGTMMEPGE